MSKSTKQLIVLCIVLVILVGGYFGIGVYKKYQEQKAIAAQIHVGDLADLVDVSYTLDGEKLSFYLDGKVWRCSADPARPLDPKHFEKIKTYLVGLTAAKTIQATDTIEAYGLDKPCTFEATDDKGHSVTLLLGGAAGDGVNCYARFPGNDTIYVIDNALLWYTGKTLDYMTAVDDIPEISDKDLIGFSVSCADGNIIVAPGAEIGHDENGNPIYEWWVKYNDGEPVLLDEEGERVIYEIRSLIKNTMWFSACTNYNAGEEDLKEYGLDSPVLAVDTRWTDTYSETGEGEYIVRFGDKVPDQEYYYAKLDGSNSVGTFRALGFNQFYDSVSAVAAYLEKNQ